MVFFKHKTNQIPYLNADEWETQPFHDDLLQGESCYFTQILPVIQIFLLQSFSNDMKKKNFKVVLPWDFWHNSCQKNECTMSVRIKLPIPVYRTEWTLIHIYPHLLLADFTLCEKHIPVAIFFLPLKNSKHLQNFQCQHQTPTYTWEPRWLYYENQIWFQVYYSHWFWKYRQVHLED